MSIHLIVGIWLDYTEEDTELTHQLSEQFAILNQLLIHHNLPPHHEPTQANSEPFSLTITHDMFPFRELATAVEQASHLRFPHLLKQSGNEGLYLPRLLDQPIEIPADSPLHGTIIGSSANLRQECALLAHLLGRYDEIVTTDDRQHPKIKNWQALSTQFETSGEWTPAVSGCQKLYTAASYSQQTGCALLIG